MGFTHMRGPHLWAILIHIQMSNFVSGLGLSGGGGRPWHGRPREGARIQWLSNPTNQPTCLREQVFLATRSRAPDRHTDWLTGPIPASKCTKNTPSCRVGLSCGPHINTNICLRDDDTIRPQNDPSWQPPRHGSANIGVRLVKVRTFPNQHIKCRTQTQCS